MDTLHRITQELIKRNKTQKDLTDFLGVHKNTYSAWNAGRNKSYNKYIYQIADFLGVSVDYLRGDSDDVGTSAAGDVNAAELLNIYNKLSAVDRAKLLVYADSLLSGK